MTVDESITLEECLKRGSYCLDHKQWDKAKAYLLPFVAAHSQWPDGWNKLAAAYVGSGEHAEAENASRRCLALDPANADAMVNLAVAVQCQYRDTESIDLCERALQLAPEFPNAHWCEAFALLRLGRWREAWGHYQWGMPACIRPARFPHIPEWIGYKPIPGRRLYIWMEQGIGDAIMMLQLIKPLREKFAPGKVILEVRPELVDLFWGRPLVDEVVAAPANRHKPREFDEHCSMMSLPSIIGLEPQNLPFATHYFGDWQPIGECEIRTVGYCWYGSDWGDTKSTRNVPASVYEHIRWQKGITAVSLHSDGPCSNPDLNEWSKTARAIGECDAVVTVDTGVAHLAGAMGKRVFILTHHIPEWRWQPNATWYPTAEVRPQETAGDWEGLLKDVCADWLTIEKVPSL